MPIVAPNSHIHKTPNHTNCSASGYPLPPVPQNSYASSPVAPLAPYRNDENHIQSLMYPTTIKPILQLQVTDHHLSRATLIMQ